MLSSLGDLSSFFHANRRKSVILTHYSLGGSQFTKARENLMFVIN